jgi:hypothetical protein
MKNAHRILVRKLLENCHMLDQEEGSMWMDLAQVCVIICNSGIEHFMF